MFNLHEHRQRHEEYRHPMFLLVYQSKKEETEKSEQENLERHKNHLSSIVGEKNKNTRFVEPSQIFFDRMEKENNYKGSVCRPRAE